MLKEIPNENELKPLKKLQVLKCVSCRFKNECNILFTHHLKDKASRLYFLKLNL